MCCVVLHRGDHVDLVRQFQLHYFPHKNVSFSLFGDICLLINIHCARESGGRPAPTGLKIRPLLDERIPSSGSINSWSPDKQLIFSHILLEKTKPKPDKTQKGLGVDLLEECKNSKISTVFMGWHRKHFTSLSISGFHVRSDSFQWGWPSP